MVLLHFPCSSFSVSGVSFAQVYVQQCKYLCMEVFLYSSIKTGSCQISCTGDCCMHIVRYVAVYPYMHQHRLIFLVLPLKTVQVAVFSHKGNHYLLRLGVLPWCLHSHASHLEAHMILKCMTRKREWTLLPFLSRVAYNLNSSLLCRSETCLNVFISEEKLMTEFSVPSQQKFIQVPDWAIDQTGWGIFIT